MDSCTEHSFMILVVKKDQRCFGASAKCLIQLESGLQIELCFQLISSLPFCKIIVNHLWPPELRVVSTKNLYKNRGSWVWRSVLFAYSLIRIQIPSLVSIVHLYHCFETKVFMLCYSLNLNLIAKTPSTILKADVDLNWPNGSASFILRRAFAFAPCEPILRLFFLKDLRNSCSSC